MFKRKRRVLSFYEETKNSNDISNENLEKKITSERNKNNSNNNSSSHVKKFKLFYILVWNKKKK